jgi:hypothetical protein
MVPIALPDSLGVTVKTSVKSLSASKADFERGASAKNAGLMTVEVGGILLSHPQASADFAYPR